MSLSSNDAVKSRRIKRILLILIAILDGSTKLSPQQRKLFQISFNIITIQYLSLVIELVEELERPLRTDKTINSFSNSDCYIYFRFNREQLRRLFVALRIPDTIVLSNRSSINGKEAFLRGIFELESGANQHHICVIFGREGSTQSRAFSWFIGYIYDNFSHLVNDNLQWWL